MTKPERAASAPHGDAPGVRAYPAHLTATERLRDGATLTVRPIAAADLRLEHDFVAGLSPGTRYQRLLSGRQLLPGELRRLTDIDYRCELALVAVAEEAGGSRIVGVARYVRDDGIEAPGCDFAIVVADAWQGRGVGELLLRRLLQAAVDDGLRVVAGITLSSNTGMLKLARRLGFQARREPGDATVTALRWEAVVVAAGDPDRAAKDTAGAPRALAYSDRALEFPPSREVPAVDAPCGCRSGRSQRLPVAQG